MNTPTTVVARPRLNRGVVASVAALAASSLLLSACSSKSSSSASSSSAVPSSSSAASDTSSASASTSATASASAGGVQLPAGVTGDLVAPAVVGYPPYAYVEGGKIKGISTDLATALSGPFGKPVTLKKDSFENSLLGVNRGTYFGVFGADVTADREKAFDQVSFLEDHYEFMSLASGADLGSTLDALCGKKISLVAAASSIPVLNDQSTKCKTAGKQPITLLTFPDQGAATLAVQSKQADATTATITNLGFIAKQAGTQFKLGGPKYLFVLIGIATKKGNGMAQAIADGINQLIAGGQYQQILKTYGVDGAAVQKAEVNPNPTVSTAGN